jgi:predicted DNA-binding transcriptional regulator AlpA
MSQKLRKRAMADRYGVTTKTIDRWSQDSRLGFPQPLHINATPIWDLGEVERWERERARPGRPQAESTELGTC